MKDSSTTSQGTPEVYEDRIQRVYRDTTRDLDFYGGHVWKVEYSQAYSHADRWFTTLQEATNYATEQERFRVALTPEQLPPTGFTADPGFYCYGEALPNGQICDQPTTYSGPSRYTPDGSMGITTAWSAPDGLEFHIDQRPGARLDLASAKVLHQLLGATILEVEDATA
jgi:hypothetical protein